MPGTRPGMTDEFAKDIGPPQGQMKAGQSLGGTVRSQATMASRSASFILA
jgi:hypothetical protein